jgi:hypothetical protein
VRAGGHGCELPRAAPPGYNQASMICRLRPRRPVYEQQLNALKKRATGDG